MNQYHEIAAEVDKAAEKARANKGTKSAEEIKQDFFADMAATFNKHIAGPVILVDGRKVNIPEI